MPDYRRWHVPGGTYFFTLVTYGRAPILTRELARRTLRKSIAEEQASRPFELRAIVLLPDHLHAIWTLPSDDVDYSIRWSAIKAAFTRDWLACGGWEGRVFGGKRREGRRGVWQPRFIEHTISDEDDLEAHFDYLHYNPVKHGHADAPNNWPWSTFHKYVRLGEYSPDWGRTMPDLPEVDEDLLE